MLISFERANEIAALYYDDVYHLCLSRLHREEDAHDVTQEVFLFFQEHYGELEDFYIKKWLYAVASNKIKEQFREIAKREKELIFGSALGSRTSAELVYEIQEDNLITSEEIESKKSDIIASLTEKELALFEMLYEKHMEYKEMAKALDITDGALKTRISRLNAKIKGKVTYAFMALLLLIMKI